MNTSVPMSPAAAGAPSHSIVIRPLDTWDEYLAAEDIQRFVWRMSDWRDAVPANLLITVAKNGGAVLGAFDDRRLVGLAFSFIGLDSHFDSPLLKHTSHMLAVLPEYQSRKIGAQLKLHQRVLALAQGIRLMTWTFDPLLALNANLNIARLGAIARRYVPDAYGEMTDGLNAGLASDRFEVEWWLDSPRVRAHVANEVKHADWTDWINRGALRLVSADTREPHVQPTRILRETAALLIEIPPDLNALKASSRELAQAWRMQTRLAFQQAFAAGFAATDFVLTRGESIARAAYVLSRIPPN